MKALAMLIASLAAAGIVCARSGGDMDVVYESVNAGGASFATNAAGAVKLGGTLGQGGMFVIATNADKVCQSGFWKAEDACTLYPATITDVASAAGQMQITFMVVNSNRYEVLYVTGDEGGVTVGQHAFTNSAASLVGKGSASATTTIVDNVSGDAERYYLIRCRD